MQYFGSAFVLCGSVFIQNLNADPKDVNADPVTVRIRLQAHSERDYATFNKLEI